MRWRSPISRCSRRTVSASPTSRARSSTWPATVSASCSPWPSWKARAARWSSASKPGCQYSASWSAPSTVPAVTGSPASATDSCRSAGSGSRGARIPARPSTPTIRASSARPCSDSVGGVARRAGRRTGCASVGATLTFNVRKAPTIIGPATRARSGRAARCATPSCRAPRGPGRRAGTGARGRAPTGPGRRPPVSPRTTKYAATPMPHASSTPATTRSHRRALMIVVVSLTLNVSMAPRLTPGAGLRRGAGPGGGGDQGGEAVADRVGAARRLGGRGSPGRTPRRPRSGGPARARRGGRAAARPTAPRPSGRRCPGPRCPARSRAPARTCSGCARVTSRLPRRREADAAGDRRREVGQDVAEQVVGDDHVVARRVGDQVDRRRVHVLVGDGDVGVLRARPPRPRATTASRRG